MIELVLTKEGQKAMEGMLGGRPWERYRENLLRGISLIMNEQGIKEADRGLVIEAAKLVLPPIFYPIIRSVEEPDILDRFRAAEKLGANEYYAQSVHVRRWDKLPGAKEAKRAANMKVLAFNASPRVGGNTDVLINEALRGARDAGAIVEKIQLQKMKLGFCISCNKCKEPDHKGFCVQKDDMREVFPKILDSTAIIVGFPIYLARECGQLATFFDRWYCIDPHAEMPSKRLGTGKVAMVIGTWGVPFIDVYDHVIEKMTGIMRARGIITVEALSACGFEGLLNTLHGLDDEGKGIIRKFPKELEKAYQAGKSLVVG